MTTAIAAGELMDECTWIYVAASDMDAAVGPKEPHDGYNVADYFDLDSGAGFASRADALAALRAAYKGPDDYGVGLDIPAQ